MFIFIVGMHVLLGHIVYVTDVDAGCARRRGVGEVDIPIAEDVKPAHVSHTLHAVHP